MHRLIVLLLSVSISFESLAVLTQLFVMKAKHNYCPILLVSNVDALEPTGQDSMLKIQKLTKTR